MHPVGDAEIVDVSLNVKLPIEPPPAASALSIVIALSSVPSNAVA